MVGAVVGEYLGAAAGLGYLIPQAEGTFDMAGVFASTFALAVFVIIIDRLVTLVERRLPGVAAGRVRKRTTHVRSRQALCRWLMVPVPARENAMIDS